MDNLIIEPHYLPNIRYFTYLFHSKQIILDDESIFEKQSYRNRSYISGANGPLCLIVPVKKGKTKQIFKDVKIDYSTNWQHIHWTSIFSAYNNSPFFGHFSSCFEPYFFRKYDFLLDLNIDLIREISKQLRLDSKIVLQSENKDLVDLIDLRNHIHPKEKFSIRDEFYLEQEYIQVFSDRYSYQKGLSVLDLLFCEGSQSDSILLNNLKT